MDDLHVGWTRKPTLTKDGPITTTVFWPHHLRPDADRCTSAKRCTKEDAASMLTLTGIFHARPRAWPRRWSAALALLGVLCCGLCATPIVNT